MKKILLLLLFIPIGLFAQNPNTSEEELLNIEYAPTKLKPENFKEKYLHYDFSNLILPKTDFLGYIGSKYRRIKIKYKTVKKNSVEKDKYDIIGYSIVGSNKCDFKGYIRIEKIKELNTLKYGADDMYKDSSMKAQGILIGRYLFEENKSQNHVGVFKGIYLLYWYIDRKGKLRFDDIENYSDSYSNNEYTGTWTEYGKSESKICNWGEYRIPNSKDLDIGAGEFSPDPKYKEYGWEDY